MIKNDPLPLETLNEISDIAYGCLKRNSDERMTIEQILDSEYLKDAKQKNTIKTIFTKNKSIYHTSKISLMIHQIKWN